MGWTEIRVLALTCSGLVAWAGCSSDGGSRAGPDGAGPDATTDGTLDASGCLPPAEPQRETCADCPTLSIENDPPAAGHQWFFGYADPTLAADSTVPGRVWLAYSWPHVVDATDDQGNPIQVALVETHLAVSEDGGESFHFVGVLFPSTPTPDPEGRSADGWFDSETPSLVHMPVDGAEKWIIARLHYFQQPIQGYHPRYGTGWMVRIEMADSPEELGGQAALNEAAVLGVSTTASVYHPTERLDLLAGLPWKQCAMVNNPALFAKDNTLYLAVDCLAFTGTPPDMESDWDHQTVQLFATEPAGPPSSWQWRHVGALGGKELAERLGGQLLQQPELEEGSNGQAFFLVTLAEPDPSVVVGTAPLGCVAVEVASLEPPSLAEHCNGNLRVLARLDHRELGACTYDPNSATGMLAHHGYEGSPFRLYATGLSP